MAKMIDTHFSLTPDNRHEILQFGPEKFNKLIKLNIPCISSIFKSYKIFKHNFPTQPDTNDNSWLQQNIFYNNNFFSKQPNNNRTTFLTTTFFGLPDTYHKLNVINFYSHNTFITHDKLNTMTNTNLHTLHYNNLKFQITSKIGHTKKNDALQKLNNPKKKSHTATPKA